MFISFYVCITLFILGKWQQILPEDVIGPSRPGRKIVILGDTCENKNIAPLCVNADLIVHEATNENSQEDQCKKNGHSTPGMNFMACMICIGSRVPLM